MKKRSLICLAMVLCLVIGIGVGVTAASSTEEIKALLNYGIQIKYNGVTQSFTDAQGTPVFPISYNGTTYLPVRAVSNLVGLAVDWDGANNTVILGEREYRVNVSASDFRSYERGNEFTSDKAYLVVNGEAYDYGILLNDIYSSSYTTDSELKVGSKYQTLHFTVKNPSNDSATLQLKDKKTSEVYKTIELSGGEVATVDANVQGCDTLVLSVNIKDINYRLTLVDVYFK